MSSSEEECRLIPPDELRCIWMSAGVLSYQLCDRMYDCDHCPLDAGMRKESSPSRGDNRDSARRGGRPAEHPSGLRAGLSYGRTHCWVKQLESGGVRLGIEPGLAAALLSPKAVVFPPVGEGVQTGRAALWIVTEGGAFPVSPPVAGVVSAVNRALLLSPFLLCLEPFDEGWLLELQRDLAASPEEIKLMNEAEARKRYAEDARRLSALLAGAARSGRPDVGPTLADGGKQLQRISDILGPSRYLALLRKAYD
jgi:glycine cleavage system H lipoate-binding protein